MARDPNEIKREGWLDAPDDFQGITPPEGVDKSGLGTTWYARERVYMNGRRVIEWYKRNSGGGAGGQGDAIFTSVEDTVPSVKKAWDDEDKKESEAAGKKVKRSYPGTDPATNLPAIVTEYEDGSKSYDSSKPAATGSQGQTTTIEGTQRPDGSWDNEQPREVVRRPDGTLVSSKPLEGAALTDWRNGRERSRNPGGKTDKEIQDEKDKKADDTTVADVSYTGTGKARQKVTTYKSGRKVTEAAPSTATAVSTRYDQNGTKITKYDDGTETSEESKPSGSFRAVPAGAPRFVPDPSDPNGDYGLTRYHEQLMAAAQSGAISREDGAYLIEQASRSATLSSTRDVQQQNQGITQRGQDLGEVQSRRSAANDMYKGLHSAYSDLGLKAMGGEGGLAARAFRTALTASQANAQQWGGLRDVPQVSGTYQQAVRGGDPMTAGTQVSVGPDGNVQVSPPGSPPPGSAVTTPAPQGVRTGAPPPAGQPDQSRPIQPARAGQPALGQGQDLSTPPSASGQTRDGNERPDDVLTLRTPEGAINQITRAQWDAHPENQSAFEVVNAESAAAATSRQVGGQVVSTPAGMPSTAPQPYGQPDTSPIFQPGPHPTSVTSDGTPNYGQPGMRVLPDPQMPVNVPYPSNAGAMSRVPLLAPSDPYMAAMGRGAPPQFSPDRAALKAQFPDLTDDELEQVISEGMAA